MSLSSSSHSAPWTTTLNGSLNGLGLNTKTLTNATISITLLLLAMTTATLGFLKRSGRRKDSGSSSKGEELKARVEGLERDCVELRERADASERAREDAEKRLEGIIAEREQAETALESTRGENAVLEETMRGLRSELEDVRSGHLEALRVREVREEERVGRMVAERQRAEAAFERQLESARAENAALEETMAVLRTELDDVRREHRLLASERADALRLLDDARAKLPPEDRLTSQAVLVLVQALNTEIKETAVFLADAFEFEEKQEPSIGHENEGEGDEAESEEMTEVLERATEILGSEMVSILRKTSHHRDPALVRIGFQGGMVEYTRWMSASWFFEDPEDEQLLADIYQRVRMAPALDAQAAGRWRALTHAHVQELIQGHGQGEPALGEYFVDAFVNVLLAAGFKSSVAALHALISERPDFAARIGTLVSLARGLNRAVGAEVTLCELKTTSATPGVAFDPDTMALVEEQNGEAGKAETVVCTCELGLARADKLDGVWTRTILLKPKVILESGVEELTAQRTPTRTSKKA
ncbi:hypothetical protein C8F01DRAFT_1260810 [Mycena amicta]|nr:hypothetical protein C8F01DRAFT_1260810 [Mycena amicta]